MRPLSAGSWKPLTLTHSMLRSGLGLPGGCGLGISSPGTAGERGGHWPWMARRCGAPGMPVPTGRLCICSRQPISRPARCSPRPAWTARPNEITRFAPLLEPLDLTGWVITADALHTQLKNLPWRTIPASARQHDRGHGREEYRTLKAATVAAGLAFPHAAQALRLTRRIRPLPGHKKWRTVTVYAITSLTVTQATPAQLAGWIRGHWRIEVLHHIRNTTYGEDASQVTSPSGS